MVILLYNLYIFMVKTKTYRFYRKMTINGHFFYIIYIFLFDNLPFKVIFLYTMCNLYIFVWLQHLGSNFKPSKLIVELTWFLFCIPASVLQRGCVVSE